MKIKLKLKRKFIVFFSLYFVLLTFYLTIFTFSKYIGFVTDENTADIAGWGVSIDDSKNQKDEITLIAGNTQYDYVLSIQSTSEVATTYSIKLKNLPDNIDIALDGSDYIKPTNNQVTFLGVGSFKANDFNKIVNHTITFNAPLGFQTINGQKIDIEVTFTQKEI